MNHDERQAHAERSGKGRGFGRSVEDSESLRNREPRGLDSNPAMSGRLPSRPVIVSEEPIATIGEYARIPIAFEITEVFDVAELEDGRFDLSVRPVARPYVKDYDALETPTEWAIRFDVSKWGLLAARMGDQLVGGAAIAYDTPAVDMLEHRSDLAVLWDLRVVPSLRRRGVGATLFEAAENWALARSCRQLKIETQNVNAAACRFYASRGCVIGAINRHAYPDLPGEVQLLWYKDLARPA